MKIYVLCVQLIVSPTKYYSKYTILWILYIFAYYVYPMHFDAIKYNINASKFKIYSSGLLSSNLIFIDQSILGLFFFHNPSFKNISKFSKLFADGVRLMDTLCTRKVRFDVFHQKRGWSLTIAYRDPSRVSRATYR